jgi:hypothetical protein
MIQNFVPDDLYHLKRLRRSYRVYEHISMDPDEMFRVENAVFILFKNHQISCCISKACDTAGQNKKP